MKQYLKSFLNSSVLFFSFLSMANAQNQSVKISVKNNLDFFRNEVVSIKGKSLSDIIKGKKHTDLRIKKGATNDYVVLQWVDNNQDGKVDELLFQAEVPAKASSKFEVVFDKTIPLTESATTTYSRFVPERTDDYAWENDKVAFRTFGPDAQDS